ncbi:MAG: carotenoid biosynthesis protein, partial [Thermosynechococcaceae cyanobacterium]
MKRLVVLQRICLVLHSLAMVFGLAGLVLVLPHPRFILTLPSLGQQLFQLSMAGGGATYIVLGAVAVALYGYHNFGLSAV